MLVEKKENIVIFHYIEVAAYFESSVMKVFLPQIFVFHKLSIRDRILIVGQPITFQHRNSLESAPDVPVW